MTLALRVFTWFRNPILRVAGAGAGEVAITGDYSTVNPWRIGGAALGQSPGRIEDVYRLHWQAEEQIHWTFGTGNKPSLENMPTWYFPAGGGMSGDLAGATDLLFLQNTGYDGQNSILKLARAVLLPPRQNLICKARMFQLEDNSQASTFGTSQGSRNMLSIRDNLNAIDAIQKVITFTFDGLFSRDVQ